MTAAGNDRLTAPPLILVTRPAEDAGPLMAALAARGYDPRLTPLLTMEWLDGPPLDLGGVGALAFTSANGLRACCRRTGRRDLPVFAVGDATARTARAAGFADVTSAGGDIQALAALIRLHLAPDAGVLLHVAGTDVAGDLALLLADAGYTVRRDVLYRAVAAADLPVAAAGALAGGRTAGVVFFSPRTAQTFVTLAAAAGVSGAGAGTVAYCLSPAVAAAAGGMPWQAVRVADRPDQDSLLALLAPVGLPVGR